MIKKQRHSVRLSCASSSASTRNARLFACSRALPHFSLSGYRFSLLYLQLFFFACSLVLFFSFILVCIRSKPSVSFPFFFFLFTVSRQVGLPASPRVLQKKGRGARREARGEKRYFFFCFISIAIEYLATDTDHDRSRKKIALARRGTDRARRQHRRGPWAGVYGVDRAATLVARPLPAPSEGHGPRKRVHIRYTHGNLSQELVTIVIN